MFYLIMGKEIIVEKLKELTGKSRVILTRRGNKALKFTLKAIRGLGEKKLCIQDQGGWLTYPQYAKELGFQLVELKTDYGLVNIEELKEKIDCDCVLLINSMPGYFALENMEEIAGIAKEANSILINDVSGSIGTENAKFGDIIFGSFGRWKPLNVEYGGFIAVDEEYFKNIFKEMQSVFDDKFVPVLLEKIQKLDARIKFLKEAAAKVKRDLKDFEIIHPESEGLNVVVKFNSEDEKEKILNYCSKNNFEHTICPRYIRVNADAVCIEVKRNG